MAFEIVCPGCGRKLRVSDEAAGQNVLCPACQTVMVAPEPSARGPLSGVAEILAEEEAHPRKSQPRQQENPYRSPALHRKRRRTARRPYRSGEVELGGLEWLLVVLCTNIACIVSIIWIIQSNPKGIKLLLATLAAYACYFVIGSVVLGVVMALNTPVP